MGFRTPEEIYGKSREHEELPADARLAELDGDVSKTELASGQTKGVEMEQPGRNKIVHEMPVGVSR